MEYESYQQKMYKRRRRRQVQRTLRTAVAVLALLLVSGLITLLISLFSGKKPLEAAPDSVAATGSALAPLPFGGAEQQAPEAAVLGPVLQTADWQLTGHDFTRTALAECGVVTTGYFADAAFLGDSITQGFTEYDIGLSGALVCGYIGTSPVDIVNGTALTHSERGKEVPLEVLTAAQPKKLYILMGTNLLVTEGIDDSFIAYYGKMLDMLKERLPDTQIYVQSLLPVRPEVTEEKPGLDNERFRTLNAQLAALAAERGLYYIDLQELFADENGNLSEKYAAGDGIHLNVTGYGAWVNYLCRHVPYNPENPWLPGSTYYRA